MKEDLTASTKEVAPSYAQSIYGFFSSVTKQIYVNSPVNFSTLTGWRFPGIPRLAGNPVVGRLTSLFAENGIFDNLLAAGKVAARHPSGMCYYWLGHKCVLLITKPEHLREVLIENDKNTARGSSFKIVSDFFGPNMLTDPHDLWTSKRIIYSDWVAKQSSIKSYQPQFMLAIDNFIARIQSCENTPVDMQKLINIFTVESIVRCLILPYATPEEIERIFDHLLKIARNIMNLKALAMWKLPTIIRNFLSESEYKDFDSFKAAMRNAFKEILLDSHEETIRNTDNFIHAIYELRSNKEEDLSDAQDVFGDANMILIGGSDTTACVLQFAIKLLCSNPHIEEKLHEELNNGLEDEELTFDNVNKIAYLDMIVKETMRMYPVAPLVPRDVVNPFELDGIPLLAGDIVMYSPYLTHHSNDLWGNPEQFIPERFTKDVPRFAYVPFGEGPHSCIGQRFALQEMKMLLAAIYSKYHVEVENNNFTLTVENGNLKPKDPIMARFTPIAPELHYQKRL